MMKLRDHRQGFFHVIGAIIVAIILIAAIFAFLVLPLLSSDEQKAICGSSTEKLPRRWFEIVLNRWDPNATEMVGVSLAIIESLTEFIEFMDDFDLVHEADGKDWELGKAEKYEYGGRTFVAIALYGACELIGQNAETYKGDILGNSLEIAILVALAISPPGDEILYIAFQVILQLILDGILYEVGDSVLSEGPVVSGIQDVQLPNEVEGKSRVFR
jgi:hypothetical protein